MYVIGLINGMSHKYYGFFYIKEQSQDTLDICRWGYWNVKILIPKDNSKTIRVWSWNELNIFFGLNVP